MNETLAAFQRLTEIMAELREKCPWDRVQTKESIRHLTIEESYELTEAILRNDYAEMRGELGDLLLHIVFYSHMAAEEGQFTLREVIEGINAKLIRRHPHIYGTVQAEHEADVRANWEQIKAQEKAAAGKPNASVLDGVPGSLPGLVKAQRMQEKASQVGFDWPGPEAVWAKVQEEIQEFQEAETPEEQEAEMGDLLFSLVNYCRFKGINAEDALARTNLKFKRRFEFVERQAAAAGNLLRDMTLEEMDVYWDQAKQAGL
ncbi:MAG: nucleoside triphosphate pyrophosphohydrolase [Bacteroidia bacterium]|nr:nucleoside triphosphate pyrophosphohydrolase [Bacteroidia bacterium]